MAECFGVEVQEPLECEAVEYSEIGHDEEGRGAVGVQPPVFVACVEVGCAAHEEECSHDS